MSFVPTCLASKWSNIYRPVLAAALVLTAGLIVAPVVDVKAQTSGTMLDFMNAFGHQGNTNTRPVQRRKKTRKPPNDLRPNTIPWRSDEVVMATNAAVERYRKIAAAGGWRKVPAGRMMRLGDYDERVPLLRARLRATGDMQRRRSNYEDTSFDEYIEAGVKRFQRRHGLRVTGRVQRATFAALNVTAEERLAQLRLNLRRITSLANQSIEERYILVNVPAFQLEAVERYEVAQRHRVIAGRPTRETPSLRATVTGVNFFPYWHVPISIARKDLVPRLKKEPDYLTKEKIRVVDGYSGPEIDPRDVDWEQADFEKVKFRQDPGPQNALGLVRIDMFNEHNVYMHDTPMQNLFNSSLRAYSAGCVRVQGVFDLVAWINKYEQGWDRPGRVQEVLEQGVPLDLKLTRPVPVYFTYITAWGEPGSVVQFRADIYQQDGSSPMVAGVQDPDDQIDPAAAAVLTP
ncbi:MAG: L,D-transpeptidase family protein [Hyphomicrobiaceae bacterium]